MADTPPAARGDVNGAAPTEEELDRLARTLARISRGGWTVEEGVDLEAVTQFLQESAAAAPRTYARAALGLALDLTGAQAGTMYLGDGAGGLRPVAHLEDVYGGGGGWIPDLPDCVREALDRGTPLLPGQGSAGPGEAAIPLPVRPDGPAAGMLPPEAYVGGDALGAMHFVDVQVGEAALRRVLVPMAGALAESLAVRLAYEEATHDELTGLRLRRQLPRIAAGMVRGAEARGQVVAALALDVRGLAAINRIEGYRTGDRILVETAQALERAAGPEAFCCRWGGDEFLALIPGCDARTALLRAAEVESAVRTRGERLARVRLSAGAAGWPEHADSADALIARAVEARNAAGRADAPRLWDPEAAAEADTDAWGGIATGDPSRDAHGMMVLLDVLRAVSDETDADALLERVTGLVEEAVGADRTVVWRPDTDGFAVWAARRAGRTGTAAAAGADVQAARRCTEEGGLLLDNAGSHGRRGRRLAVPVRSGRRLTAVLYADLEDDSPRDFDRGDLAMLEAVARQVGTALEQVRLRAHSEERRRMAGELNTASEIQLGLVPDDVPDVPGLEPAGIMMTAKEIGGDYYDFFPDPEGGGAWIVIGDVSGKGVPAGLLMAMAKSALTTLVRGRRDLPGILSELNGTLRTGIARVQFMTMLLLRWEPDTRELVWSGAGHEHLLVLRGSGGGIERIPAGGLALGMVDDASSFYEEHRLELEPGDLVFLYTDGITEAQDEDGAMFGMERLCAAITAHRDRPAQEILTAVAESAGTFIGDTDQYDDITMVCLRAV